MAYNLVKKDQRFFSWAPPEADQQHAATYSNFLQIGAGDNILIDAEIELFEIPEAYQIIGGFLKIHEVFPANVNLSLAVGVVDGSAGTALLAAAVDADGLNNGQINPALAPRPKKERTFPRQTLRLVVTGAAINTLTGKVEVQVQMTEAVAAAA